MRRPALDKREYVKLMPKRALIERRPWLVASVLAALAFAWLQDSRVPGVYLLALGFAPLLLLAIYAVLRHKGSDTRLLAAMLVLEGAGWMAASLSQTAGWTLQFFGCLLGIRLFMNHRSPVPDWSGKVFGVCLLLVPPLGFLMLAHADVWPSLSFGFVLGGMAASAWVSTFPPFHMRSGTSFIVLANLIAASAPYVQPDGTNLPGVFAWPLFFVGNLILAIGITGELRARTMC